MLDALFYSLLDMSLSASVVILVVLAARLALNRVPALFSYLLWARGDPLWKALAFAALTLHWFNPLVWLAFFLAERDMELSCDERAVKGLDQNAFTFPPRAGILGPTRIPHVIPEVTLWNCFVRPL